MNGKSSLRRLGAIFAAAFALLAPGEGATAGLDFTPALRIEGIWDSNVFNSTVNKKDDFFFRVQPQVTFGLKALETTFQLSGSMAFDRYRTFTELDRDAVNRGITLYPSDPIQVTPAFSLRPTAYYFETSDSGQRAIDRIGPAPAPTGETGQGDLTVIQGRSPVREYSGNLTVNYTPTQNLETIIQGWALKHEYLEAAAEEQGFRNFGGEASIFYLLTARFRMGPYLRYVQTDYNQGLTSQVYIGGLGGRYILSEGQFLVARAGISQSQYNTTPSQTTNAPYGFLLLDTTWEAFRSAITAEYGVASGGVLGVPVKRFRGDLWVEKGLTPRTTLELFGGYQRNMPEDQDAVIYWNASARVRYLAYRWLATWAAWTYYWQKGAAPDALERHNGMIGFEISNVFTII